MSARRTNTLSIRTPEGISFAFILAGPLVRFFAWAVDFACIAAIAASAGAVLGLAGLISQDAARAISILAYFVVSIGYGMFLEWFWRGQTIGKKLFRLRVIDAEGLHLQFNQVVVRNLLRFIDMLPAFYLVGGVACLLSRRAQRLGDFAANTLVIRTPKLVEPDLEQLMAGKFNSLRQFPHLQARLRQRVSPAEAAIAAQAVLRRAQFEPDARIQLFRELADHFRSLVAFPPEALDGITDEQYVRNVVDILYQTRPSPEPMHPIHNARQDERVPLTR